MALPPAPQTEAQPFVQAVFLLLNPQTADHNRDSPQYADASTSPPSGPPAPSSLESIRAQWCQTTTAQTADRNGTKEGACHYHDNLYRQLFSPTAEMVDSGDGALSIVILEAKEIVSKRRQAVPLGLKDSVPPM